MSTSCIRTTMKIKLLHSLLQRSTAVGLQRRSLYFDGNNTSLLLKRIFKQQSIAKRWMSPIVEEGAGTHKPSDFQKKMLVWGKMYPSADKIPDRVTRNQLRVAMDKFRVRCCIIMMALTVVASLIYALIGRKEREGGKTVNSIALARRQE